jgi:metal-dependent amidase/aminoacylase/carboxypeptidase family protein
MSDTNERPVASAGSQPVMAIVSSDEAALRIIVRQQRSEIERLKDAIRRIADQDATLSVCNGNVTVTMDATLTRYERHCIKRVRDIYADEDDVACNEIAAVLDGLLERTK